MNDIAAMSEQLLSERIKEKLNEVNVAAQTRLSPIQDHVNFTLQQAYFKCAHECFDRRRSQQDISNCAENCSVPVVRAQQGVENEMAKFQENLLCELDVFLLWSVRPMLICYTVVLTWRRSTRRKLLWWLSGVSLVL